MRSMACGPEPTAHTVQVPPVSTPPNCTRTSSRTRPPDVGAGRTAGPHHRRQLGRGTGGSAGVPRRGRPGRGAGAAVARVPGAIVLRADITDRPAVEAAVASAVERLGGLDVLVANAGAAGYGHFLEVHPDDFERVVAITLIGAVNTVRAALPALRESRRHDRRHRLAEQPRPAAGLELLRRGQARPARLSQHAGRRGARAAHGRPGGDGPPRTDRHAAVRRRLERAPVAPRGSRRTPTGRRWWRARSSPPPPTRGGRPCSAGETRLLDLTFAAARPVAETVLMLVDRWTRSGPKPAPQPGSLWEPPARRRAQRRHSRAGQHARRAAARPAPAALAGDARCGSRATWRCSARNWPGTRGRSCVRRRRDRGPPARCGSATPSRRRASARSLSAERPAVGVGAEDPVAEVRADAQPVALVLEVVQAVVAPDRPVPAVTSGTYGVWMRKCDHS